MKIIVFAILAVAAVCANASTESCTPGDRKMEACNSCTCIADGSGYACTEMACLTGPTCEPGKSFKHFCNTCRCPADGLVASAACTKMACIEGMFNEDGSLRQPLSDPIPRDKRQADGATCVPGTSFMNYCNTCHCPANGLRNSAACTFIGCPEGVYNEDGSLKQPLSDPIPRNKRQADGTDATCVPGTSFKHYCNTCQCGSNGLAKSAACTRMECVPGMWNEDGSLKQPLSDPIPREKRQADEVGATCVPGTSFMNYCNTCHCPPDGLRASAPCTLMGCPADVYNEDGSLKQPQSDPIPRNKRQAGADATCVPGTNFNLYCNTCFCPSNGLRSSAGCTMMGCPPGMYNEDGSLKQPLSDPIPRTKRQAEGAGATCEPRSNFRYYCNNCVCGPDGMRQSAACTRKGCPEGVYNEDGSIKQPL